MFKFRPKYFLFVLLLSWASPAFAQWTSQTFQLRAGWNVIYLEVQPDPKDCDTIFKEIPLESVRTWNRRFSSVQFIQNPDELSLAQPDWLTYLPANHPGRAAMNLFTLDAGRPYLVKLPDRSPPVSWTVRGRAFPSAVQWLSDSYNLVGFPVDPATPPTFQSFFESSPAHAGKAIYRLGSSGGWEKISSPNLTVMRSGEAFWVRCDGRSTWSGPMSATLERRSGLDYGQTLIEQTVVIKNNSTAQRTFTVRSLPSAKPLTPGAPPLAGAVPLSYFRRYQGGNSTAWIPLTMPLQQAQVAPGEQWMLRLAVRRIDMDPSPAPGISAPLYQSVLEISDGAGSRSLVPVTAQGLQTFTGGKGARIHATATHPYAGLWVGSVSVNKVSQPANSDANATSTPVPTGSDFQFRLIVHVDTNGQPRLLQKVIQVWTDGAYTNDSFGIKYVDRPGSYRLFTDENLVTNTPPWSRRISSAAFGFTNGILMSTSGSFGSNNSTNSCTVPIQYDDPLNPFKHRYHPDHDNLDERYEQVLGEKAESFTVTRLLSLVFTPNDPLDPVVAGWGDDQLGGFYRETISGLNRTPVYVSGTFRLHRVASAGVLN